MRFDCFFNSVSCLKFLFIFFSSPFRSPTSPTVGATLSGRLSSLVATPLTGIEACPVNPIRRTYSSSHSKWSHFVTIWNEKMNPKFQSKEKEKNRAKSWDLTCPSGLLSHFTNSRPRLPFLFDCEVNRTNGATRSQSGHGNMGTGPCWGHEGREAELENDISRRRSRRIAEERGDNGGRARASLCVGGEGGWLGPTIGRTRLFSAANQVAGTNLSRIAIGILLEDSIWGVSFGARAWSDG